jgi:CRISPR-associated protein Cas2
MFVAVVIDPGSEDNQKLAANMLFRYGYKQRQANVFESTSVTDKQLARLKLDLDRICDFYDSIRFYQFPVDDTLVITALNEKRWRRTVVREGRE